MEKLQAIFRGKRAREVQVKRYHEGKKISCPFLSSSVITELSQFVERENLVTKEDIVHDIGCGNGDIMVALSGWLPYIRSGHRSCTHRIGK